MASQDPELNWVDTKLAELLAMVEAGGKFWSLKDYQYNNCSTQQILSTLPQIY